MKVRLVYIQWTHFKVYTAFVSLKSYLVLRVISCLPIEVMRSTLVGHQQFALGALRWMTLNCWIVSHLIFYHQVSSTLTLFIFITKYFFNYIRVYNLVPINFTFSVTISWSIVYLFPSIHCSFQFLSS